MDVKSILDWELNQYDEYAGSDDMPERLIDLLRLCQKSFEEKEDVVHSLTDVATPDSLFNGLTVGELDIANNHLSQNLEEVLGDNINLKYLMEIDRKTIVAQSERIDQKDDELTEARVNFNNKMDELKQHLFNAKPRLTNNEWESGKNEGKIPCIKMVRARLGLGLKQSKDLVEYWFDEYGYSFKGYESVSVEPTHSAIPVNPSCEGCTLNPDDPDVCNSNCSGWYERRS